jgi:hypothetical protein
VSGFAAAINTRSVPAVLPFNHAFIHIWVIVDQAEQALPDKQKNKESLDCQQAADKDFV